MQLTTKTKSFRRSRRQAQTPRRVTDQRQRNALSVSQIRARRGGGIEDRALYTCECGFTWTGEVTASPCCAHCGTPQAW